MTIADLGEFGLLRLLGLATPDLPAGWVGPGDDAAVLRAPGASAEFLFTTDLLIEETHFRRNHAPPRDLGYKALAANLSDIAAMGGSPLGFVVGLALPPDLAESWVSELYAGLREGASALRCPLLGGDTTASAAICIAVAVLGTAGASGPILRGGARPGDDLFVSGTLGGSALGLQFLLAGDASGATEREVIERHLRPHPRLTLGGRLGAEGLASAMIDVSDGLLQDLGHVLTASGGLGAELHLERLPVASATRSAAAQAGIDPEPLVLAGGEDYELLFTAAPAQRSTIFAAARETATPVRRIGSVAAAKGLRLWRHGAPVPLPPRRGFDHFTGAAGSADDPG